MGILDIFKKKDKDNEEKKEEKNERKVVGNCYVCNQPIYEDEKYRTLNYGGKSYIVHIKCFRKAKKQAFDFITKGNFPRL